LTKPNRSFEIANGDKTSKSTQFKHGNNHQISIQIDDKTYGTFKKIALHKHRTVASHSRHIVMSWLTIA